MQDSVAILTNRPDIKQAELELAAAKLDVKVARAEFFPLLVFQRGGV
jgi:outer membrane protein TolC